MKRLAVLLSFIITLSFSLVFAEGAVSGDGLCGSSATTACTFDHVKIIVKKVTAILVGLGLPFLVMIVGYRIVMAWFAAREGNAGAYKEALKKGGQAIIAFLVIIIVLGGGLVVLLQYIGASDNFLKVLKLLSEAFISTAHAQATLPSPLKEDIDLYGFMLNFFGMVMQFFIYPALIVIWVWTGFGFVLAQGKPDALGKAKSLLMWATVSTLAVVLIQTFLFAARGTVEQILPGSTSSVDSTTETTPSQSPSGNVACTIDGQQGIRGVDGGCYPSRGGTITSPSGNVACTIDGQQGIRGANGGCYVGGVR